MHWRATTALGQRNGARPSEADSADFQTWAKQGRAIAARVVYSEEIRAAVAAADGQSPPRVRIDAAYRDAMAQRRKRQIGLAGQRIANG